MQTELPGIRLKRLASYSHSAYQKEPAYYTEAERPGFQQ